MKTVVISGASRGIGREITQLLLSQGHKVLAITRNTKALQDLAALYSNLIPISLDISNLPINWIEHITQHTQTIDVLINNAGVLINKPFMELDIEDWRYHFEVNLFSNVTLIKGLLSHFSVGAHIVNITSMGGVQGASKFSGLSAYSASKAALANLTECLAEELKPFSIFCNALALGAVQTEMLAEAFPNYQAPIDSLTMAKYISHFALEAHSIMNGKIIPLSISTP